MSAKEPQERDHQKKRRSTPYPQCTEVCTVTEVWGPEECELICPEKFKGAADDV